LPPLRRLVRARGAFGGFRVSAGILTAGPAPSKRYSYCAPKTERVSGSDFKPAAHPWFATRSAGYIASWRGKPVPEALPGGGFGLVCHRANDDEERAAPFR